MTKDQIRAALDAFNKLINLSIDDMGSTPEDYIDPNVVANMRKIIQSALDAQEEML